MHISRFLSVIFCLFFWYFKITFYIFLLRKPVVMHLAAVTFRMSLMETLVAATINAAASLNLAASHGSVELGKCADLLVIRAPSWEHLIYQLGNASLISTVIRNGVVMYART